MPFQVAVGRAAYMKPLFQARSLSPSECHRLGWRLPPDTASQQAGASGRAIPGMSDFQKSRIFSVQIASTFSNDHTFCCLEDLSLEKLTFACHDHLAQMTSSGRHLQTSYNLRLQMHSGISAWVCCNGTLQSCFSKDQLWELGVDLKQ